MKVQETRSNISSENQGSSESLGGIITYKRRKRASSASAAAAAEGNCSSGEQVMTEASSKAICSDTYKQDTLNRVSHNWRRMLEKMLDFCDLKECGGGVHCCIRDALASEPFSNKRKYDEISPPMDIAKPEDSCNGHCYIKGDLHRLDSCVDASTKACRNELYGKNDLHVKTRKCQNAFVDILLSEKFALLCDLLCENFQNCDSKGILDFSSINFKIEKGVYEQSSRLFGEDILEVWKKLQKIGQEMVFLASGLMDISHASYKKQVGEKMLLEACKRKSEETCQMGDERKNSTNLCTVEQFQSYASEPSVERDQTGVSCLYKFLSCKKCDSHVDGNDSLICDGCEAVYHVSCADPVIQGIPTRSWYCSSCSTIRRKSSKNHLKDEQEDGLHQNCVVCDRLDITEPEADHNKSDLETELTNDSRESSVDSMDSEEAVEEPSRTASLRLCKQCGTCEDEDKRFLVCGNAHCLYKYYHIRCLKNNQIASQQQQHQKCWYCPSCLCRGCLADKDDDKIVMCDGCDDAYHTYCMKPPRTSIPKGNWYCVLCNIKRAKEGMKKYEELVLEQLRQKDVMDINGTKRPVDVLLSVAEKLSTEQRSHAAEDR